ncbi:MAG: ABC transporter substrate-binding protein [Thermoprotei archaeon]|nr:MAG: ABC transporter substrate-binding protein [Thermoprotei archaeon]
MVNVVPIVLRSVLVSGLATLMASLWSIPIAVLLAVSKSRLAQIVLDLFNSLVSLPTVVLGLCLYMILSRSGPLGFLSLLYTPLAISIGQAVLITPLIVSVLANSLSKIRDGVLETAFALGATRSQAYLTLLYEGLPLVTRSILVGFNRAIGELGVALMLGGNIKGYTRVMTTAIALEVVKGNFEEAISLGLFFIVIIAVLTTAIRIIGGKSD